MNGIKRLKDPLYGYINIPTDIAKKIIDTATFQRLRRIIQTSYSPLYASSIHNRFVHSLGVFHLGQLAIKTISEQVKSKKIDIKNFDNIEYVFLLACLLHDVGHAPFSHTGEKFFLDDVTNNQYGSIHTTLKEVVNTDEFSKDVPPNDSNSAAPHEVMSAIIGIQSFEDFLPTSFDREFFARCITGYQYGTVSQDNSFLNCLISLLNSKVIDVDRLDYLIRDAFFTGFDTISIDYERLLTSLTIIETDVSNSEDEDTPLSVYELAYQKNAISVIENVVYAHDAERKWIQNHPAVLYEIYIIQHIISKINSIISLDDKKLFSIGTLSTTGVDFGDSIKVSLLCDDDVVFLMKNKLDDSLTQEYFHRNLRRHPLWKSEAEYRSYLRILSKGDILDSIETALKETEKYVRKNSDSWIIDESLISKLRYEISQLETNNLGLSEGTLKVQLRTKKSIQKVFKSLSNYAEKHGSYNDYVILSASQFYSGFNRPDVKNINIVFNSSIEETVNKFDDVVTLLSGEQRWRSDFFYIYHKDDSKSGIDKKEVFKYLIKEFV